MKLACTAALLSAVLLACGLPARAQQGAAPQAPPLASSANPALREALEQQARIYSSRGEEVPSGYVLDRSLLSYASTLSPAFDPVLASLGPGDCWLDIGAGQGKAVLDYYTPRYDAMHPDGAARRGKKACAVAVSIEDRRTARWQDSAARLEPQQIRYLWGKRLREYSAAELGRFQLITDLLGGFSYAAELSLYMEKALDLLQVGGHFFTLLQDIRGGDSTETPPARNRYLTEIRSPEGREVRIADWLRSIRCIAVHSEYRADWKPAVEVYHIRKTCEDIRVPALVPVHFEAGTPPERHYRLDAKTPGQAAAH